jgi:uncharacterized protein YigA (DUF484 family)
LSDLLRTDAHEQARDEAVRSFLRARPEFLHQDPELMRRLGVRPDGANVVDFGPEALWRVSRAHRRESGARKRLEATARVNFEAQALTHEAVLELMGAEDPAALAATLRRLARVRFGLVDAVIAVEGGLSTPAGWHELVEGQAELVLRGRDAQLGVVPTAHGLFGPAATRIGSVALLRLRLWQGRCAGLLAFGAEGADAFAAEMGHELIDFVARVIERMAERWSP